jgi:nicotinamidase-related amidase
VARYAVQPTGAPDERPARADVRELMARSRWAHVCVDMQSIFAEDTEWHAPWLSRTLPAIEALVDRAPARTVFTRFITPQTPQEAVGAWQAYFAHWSQMTRRNVGPSLLDLVPALARFVPPARIFDKPGYSPWLGGQLNLALQAEGVSTLIVSGGETDVCVLATVLGGMDLGYHVVLPTDALFGSADATHDAMLEIYRSRFQLQLSTCTTEELLEAIDAAVSH